MAEDRERSRSPEPAAEAPAPAADAPAPADAGGEPEGIKLYVGNLDYATDEQKLRSEFGQFGDVTDVFLPTERGTQRPRGFGFVTMATKEAADAAISKMDQAQVDGRTIRVNESRPRGSGPPGGFNASGKPDVKLYVGNLSFDTVEESVRSLFESVGTVSDCFMPTDRDTGRPRGFCFITMPSAEAEQAIGKLSGTDLDGRAIRVNEAQPKGGGGGGGRGGGGGYNDGGGGGGGGYGGGYRDGGGYGGGGGGYGGGGGGYGRDDRGGDRGGYGGGYGGGGGGYDDRGGYGGGGGGGGYGGGRGGGYDDRGGYGGGGGGYDRDRY